VTGVRHRFGTVPLLSGPLGPDLDGRTDDELIGERDFLLGSLADLNAERDAGDVDDHDYLALRDGYTGRAAAVLRALDRRCDEAEPGPRAATTMLESRPVRVRGASSGPRAKAGVTAGATGTARRSIVRAVVVVAGVLGFAVLAGVGVEAMAGRRLPGDNVSGSTPTTPVAKLLAQAQDQISGQHLLDAVKTYDKALAIDPRNAEALAYKGWLLRLAGAQVGNATLVDQGLASIRQAEAASPSYADPHFFAGETLLKDKNDPKGAVTEFEQFLADHPPGAMVPEVQGELGVAQAALGAPPTTGPPPTPAPGRGAP